MGESFLTKLDVALINSQGYGRPVPLEMDRHMVKYVIGLRKAAVEAHSNLIEDEPHDHSDVFYAVRTHLNQLGWDTSCYNDNAAGGADRRKKVYDMIKPICEEFYGVKRHQIGIFPDDRAIMTFKGRQSAISFNSLRRLMGNGTDVVFVEKAGTVMKTNPFAQKVGLAFIDSQGFGSEYGVALARLCDQQNEPAWNYTKGYVPTHAGNLSTLADCDASGVAIGIKINKAIRLGIDLNTIQEINDVNPGLDLTIEGLQEGVKPNHHFKSLQGLLENKGRLYESLSAKQVEYYQQYLLQIHIVGQEEIAFIDWLDVVLT